jgi:hypothetical protein
MTGTEVGWSPHEGARTVSPVRRQGQTQRKGTERWWAARKEGEEGEEGDGNITEPPSAFRLTIDTSLDAEGAATSGNAKRGRWTGTLLIVRGV